MRSNQLPVTSFQLRGCLIYQVFLLLGTRNWKLETIIRVK